MVELQQKRWNALAPLRGVSALGPNLLESVVDSEEVEPVFRIALEETDDLAFGKGVPVLIVEKLDDSHSLGVRRMCPA